MNRLIAPADVVTETVVQAGSAAAAGSGARISLVPTMGQLLSVLVILRHSPGTGGMLSANELYEIATAPFALEHQTPVSCTSHRIAGICES
jgi:hypothetical protein